MSTLIGVKPVRLAANHSGQALWRRMCLAPLLFLLQLQTSLKFETVIRNVWAGRSEVWLRA